MTRPKCSNAGRVGNLRTHCRHPAILQPVLNSTCETCSLFQEGEPDGNPKPQQVVCRHRGDVIASIQSGCAACKGKPIYTCDVHGQCVANRRQREEVRGVRSCEGCKEYSG